MALVKVKEVIGTSPNSFQEAFEEAIKQVFRQKENITGAKILSQTATIKEGKIFEYKVNVKYAYLWEEELHGKPLER